MRPLCETLLDDCSIKATFCDVEFFLRIPLVDLGVGWPFHSRFCLKARGGCYTAALSWGICQPGSEHRAPFLTQRSHRQTASPQVYLGLSAAVPHLTKAFARVVIGRSVCWNLSCLRDLLPWAGIKAPKYRRSFDVSHFAAFSQSLIFRCRRNVNIEQLFHAPSLSSSSRGRQQLPHNPTSPSTIHQILSPPLLLRKLYKTTHTSIILSWIWRPPSLSAGPFSTILDTKIPSFEVLSLSSCGIKCSYCLENRKKNPTVFRLFRRIVVYMLLTQIFESLIQFCADI